MKWLYLCNDLGIPLDGTKGASEHVRAVTRALCRAGLHVGVLAPRGILPPDHPAVQIENPLGAEARSAADALRKWLDGTATPTGLAGEIAQILYDARLDHAVQRPEFLGALDVVIERLSLFGAAGRRLARRQRAVYLVEMNAPISQEAARYRDTGLQQVAKEFEAQTLRGADRVLTVSDALRNAVINQYDLPPDRVVTIPNGVELELFNQPQDGTAARAFAGVPSKALVFGFVGSLRAWHGVDLLMDAFRRTRQELKAAHLLVVGDGRRGEAYRALATELGILDATTFFGDACHEEIPKLLAAMDVGLAPYLPQKTFYFSPLKLYEYMAAGLCVIASRAGQIAEVVTHTRNGLLVSPGDVEDLTRAMIEVGHDRLLRERLGEAAHDSVANLGWDSVARRIIDVANEVVLEKHAPQGETVHVV